MNAKFRYTGIRVKDLEESVKFYTQVLGMKETGRATIESVGGEVASLVSEDGGPELELNFYAKDSAHAVEYLPGEAMDHLAFKVDDLDVALDIAKKMGHPVVLDIKGKTSRWAYIVDPNGIYIELFD